jgi:hypothetical protein
MWGGQYHELSTNEDGEYDIEALRPGTYTVTVGGMVMGGMLGGAAPLARAAKSGLKLSKGEWMRDVDFRLQKPGVVEVLVVDEQGAPCAGVGVFARDDQGRLLDRLSFLSTGPNGVAKHTGLAPGHYTFIARIKGRTSSESARVEVESGETKSTKVELRAGTRLVVTALDSEGHPTLISLSVRDEAGHEVADMLSLAEVMELMGGEGFSTTAQKTGALPPGKYTVRVTRADGKSVDKSVTLAGEPELPITLKFD